MIQYFLSIDLIISSRPGPPEVLRSFDIGGYLRLGVHGVTLIFLADSLTINYMIILIILQNVVELVWQKKKVSLKK